MLTVLFFGRLTDAAGSGERRIPLPPGVADVAALRGWLGRDDPALRDALAALDVRAAVDGALAPDDAPLLGREEVAFLPPVSGG